jgi:hypothetical protein
MSSKESKAQIEVWEWKEIAYKKVENLDLKEALMARLEKSAVTAEKLGIKTINIAGK